MKRLTFLFAVLLAVFLDASAVRSEVQTGAPGDMQAAWTRGRQLADEQRFEEALAVVNDALASDPDDLDLLWLRAGIAGWSGDHAESVRLYRELMATHPRAAERVRADLEREESLAREVSSPALRPAPRPSLFEARTSGRDDSDHGGATSSSLAYSRWIGPRDLVIVLVTRDEIREPHLASAFGRLGVGHERDWTPRWASHALVMVATKNDAGVPRFLGDSWVVYRPARTLRFDLGVSRTIIESARALDAGVHVWTISAGADWDLAGALSMSAAHRVHLYTDENQALRDAAELRLRLSSSAPLSATAFARFEMLNARRWTGHGYYSPDAYAEFGPGLEFSCVPRRGWTAGLRAQWGLQQERGADRHAFSGVSASLEIPAGKTCALGLRVFRGDSNLGSDTGYEQRGWSVSLTRRR